MGFGVNEKINHIGGPIAPEIDMTQELREHMIQVGDVEENLPLDDDTVTLANFAARVAEEEASLRPPSFKMDYVESIRLVIVRVDALIARATWSGNVILTHPMASDNEIDVGLQILQGQHLGCRGCHTW